MVDMGNRFRLIVNQVNLITRSILCRNCRSPERFGFPSRI